MALSTSVFYMRGQQLTLEIESDISVSFSIESASLEYDVQEEDNPFNYTVGGVLKVDIVSDNIIQNVTSCVLKYGTEIWFQGVFKTDEEPESLETYKYFKSITFSDKLSELQELSFQKRYFESDIIPFKNNPIRFLTALNLLKLLTNENDTNNLILDTSIESNSTTLDLNNGVLSIESNSTTLDLNNIKFDSRSIFSENQDCRDVIGQVAFTYGCRVQAVDDRIVLTQITNESNLENIVNVDNRTPDSKIYNTLNIPKKISYSIDSLVENIVFNPNAICENSDGSGLLGYFSFPGFTSLTQPQIIPDPSDAELRFASGAFELLSKNGLPDFTGQEINCDVSFLVDFDEQDTFNLQTRLVYVDETDKQWALRSDGSWQYIGQVAFDPIAPFYKTFDYTDTFAFNGSNTGFDDETGFRTLNRSFQIDAQNITNNSPSDIGSYYLLCSMPALITPVVNGVSKASLQSFSIKLVRSFRNRLRPKQFDTFQELDFREYERTVGLVADYAYGDDQQLTNGVILINDEVLESTYLEDYIQTYNKVNYKDITFVTNDKITPISNINFEGLSHFVQKMNYDLFNGICNVVIKECNDE